VRLGLGESGDMEICFGDENGNDQTVTKNHVDEKESRRRQVSSKLSIYLHIDDPDASSPTPVFHFGHFSSSFAYLRCSRISKSKSSSYLNTA
jgi:hypothetical protein